MAAKRTPYEMAEEILGLAQDLVLELGGQGDGPPGTPREDEPVQLDLRAEVQSAPDAGEDTSDEERPPSRKLVGASWAPRSWS